MHKPNTNTDAPRDWAEEPVAWFAEMEIARERCDFERAAEAQRQLRRLGVHVRYERQVRGAGRAR
jgi:hypothetical protein